MSGISGEAQGFANDVVDAAQSLANSVVDLGEEAARDALGALVIANKLIGEALERVSNAAVGK